MDVRYLIEKRLRSEIALPGNVIDWVLDILSPLMSELTDEIAFREHTINQQRADIVGLCAQIDELDAEQWRLCHSECRCEGDLHYTSGPHCCECDAPFPCAVLDLVAQVERLTDERDAAREGWRISEDRRARVVDMLKAAEAKVAAALALHVRNFDWCTRCQSDDDPDLLATWPCPTAAALSSSPGEET